MDACCHLELLTSLLLLLLFLFMFFFFCVFVELMNVLHGESLGVIIVSEWTSLEEAKLTNVVDVAGR